MANAMGRPRIIETPEDFDILVDLYVAESQLNKTSMTITGLCLYMGFNSVQSLTDYSKRKGFEPFSESVKRARLIVQNGYESSALNGGGAGPIFLLKASYGYVDKQVVEMTPITVNITGKDADL